MAQVTKAMLVEEVRELKLRLAAAQGESIHTAELSVVSSALLDRISDLQGELKDEREELEAQEDKAERAYDEADSADDRIRELTGA